MAFFDAVIFDMDGVLIDSYRAHYRSWRDMAARHGLEISEEQFRASFGRTSRESMALYWGEGRFGEDEIRVMDHEKEIEYRRIITADFPAMPGAYELILALHRAGLGMAVGSSGPRENVGLAIDRLGVRDQIDVAITGSDVRHGKPDPQIFLLAAERLGVPPARCVVVEDAPVGVQAAHAAGMACVGLVSEGRTRQMLSEAELVVDSLGELHPERLRQLMG